MKIGIYGDSFAADQNYRPVAIKYHWSTRLTNELNAEITNYGKAGSSVCYSYKKFIETYKDNEFNIFLVTEPGRYVKEIKVNNNLSAFIPTYGIAEMWVKVLEKEKVSHDVDERMIRDLKGWFMSSCDEFNRDVADLMLDRILLLDPNVLLVPCFPYSLHNNMKTSLGVGENSLLMLHNFQSKCLGMPEQIWFNESADLMSGHFTPEINELFYKIILKKIQTGVWDWSLPDKINFKYKVNDYYHNKYPLEWSKK